MSILACLVFGLNTTETSLENLDSEIMADIESRFNKIHDDLDGLIDAVTREESQSTHILRRNVRSAPLGRRPQCTVSRDKLTSLNEEIKRALSNAGDGGTSNCNLNTANPNNCNELVTLIQCGVNHMRNGFMAAIANSASLHEVNKWKNAYDDLSEKHERDIDNVRASVSEEYERKIDGLKTDLQNLRRALNQALERLARTTLDLCISEVSSGQTATAISKFKELQDNTKLTEIVRSVYANYGKAEQVENIVNFVRGLPSCNQDRIAYPALAQIMKENNHFFGSPEVLIFYPAVKTCMSSTSLENELEASTNSVLDAWAYKIRTDDFWTVKQAIQKNPVVIL